MRSVSMAVSTNSALLWLVTEKYIFYVSFNSERLMKRAGNVSNIYKSAGGGGAAPARATRGCVPARGPRRSTGGVDSILVNLRLT